MKGNLHVKIDWAGLVLGRKFTVFLCFTPYLRVISKFKSSGGRRGGGGAYIWRGVSTEGFLRYDFIGLIFRGAYTWRGLFSEFYGTYSNSLRRLSQIKEAAILNKSRP